MSEENEMNIENEYPESSETMESEPNPTAQDSMYKDDETQDTIISTDLDMNSEQDIFYEEYSNTILTTLKNLRESMDKVYQMRSKLFSFSGYDI